MTWSPSATTGLAAVIGSPVRHSLSPAIHNHAFRELGVDWCFVAFEVDGDNAGAAIDAMGTLGIGGYAVTTPLKEAVAREVDEIDEAAKNLGAINTVVRRSDGSTLGASTDGDGFVQSLRVEHVDPAASPAAVLGAGGAARSIIDGLARAGCPEIVVINRNPERAERAADLAEVARVGTTSDLAHVGLIVNATTVGMGQPESPEVDASPLGDDNQLGSDQVVADIVYHPVETRLLRDARAVGARAIDGLGMLVCQAQLQQQLWLGTSGEYASLRRAALAELGRR